MIQLICATCKTPFSVQPSRARRGEVKYCSQACHYKGRRGKRVEREDAIQLSDGRWALVSSIDVEFLRNYGWVVTPSGYARRGAVKVNRGMHREVMERIIGRPMNRGEEVDHINGNKLDNRRDNLRLAVHAQNMRNQQNRKLGASGYIGVSSTSKGKWRAYLVLDNQQVQAGTFDDPAVAAWFRDQWAIELHGEFARLNFEYQ